MRAAGRQWRIDRQTSPGAFAHHSGPAANCGERGDLLRCSRCRSVYFCSRECQTSFWPLHRSECRGNEFADAVESQDPKFAAWMRRHGRQAVLKDDEVERLERARVAQTGLTHDEVLGSMYGRVRPLPAPGTYSPAEARAVADREAAEGAARQLRTPQVRGARPPPHGPPATRTPPLSASAGTRGEPPGRMGVAAAPEAPPPPPRAAGPGLGRGAG